MIADDPQRRACPHRHILGRRALLVLAGTAPLAACASEPDVDDYLPRGGGSAIRRAIIGPGHPAPSDARSSATPTTGNAADPAAQTSEALQRQFEVQSALSESPLVLGNQTHVLRNGTDAFAAMFQAMRRARDHINLEYYVLADVQSGGQSLGELLLDRLRVGVAVNIIYDSYGSQATPREFFDALHAAGAQVVEFNPLDPLDTSTGWSPNDRDHRKMMVVDGTVAFTGGVNLDKVYENPPSAGIPEDGDTTHAFWRDSAVQIEGPVVGEIQKLFFASWKDQKGPTVAQAAYFPPLPRRGVQTVRIVGSMPGDRLPLYYISLITAIRSARQKIWLSSGYFVPPHQEREALHAAARDGIDVRVVVPSHADVDSAVYAGRAAYGDLLESGARIWEVQNAVLHSKLATVDGVWSMIGSSNLDRRSVVFNNEVDAIILGADTAAQVEAILQQDMAASREVTLAAWSQRSLGERLRELQARAWEYWM
jgi:cardiolipin synthase